MKWRKIQNVRIYKLAFPWLEGDDIISHELLANRVHLREKEKEKANSIVLFLQVRFIEV